LVTIGINIFEQDFSLDQTSRYNLSVLYCADRLSYLVSNGRKVLGIREYTMNVVRNAKNELSFLQQVLREDNILRKRFKQTRVAFHTHQQTLIPFHLFDTQQPSIYLKHLVTIEKESDEVHYNNLTSINLTNAFILNKERKQLFLDTLSSPIFYHNSSGLLAYYLRPDEENKKQTNKLFVNVRSNLVTIIVTKQQELLYHNIFRFKHAEDILYYILLAYEKHQLDPNKIRLELTGNLLVDSEIYQLLHKYIRHIQFIEHTKGFSFGERLQKETPHLFLDLLSLSICE